MKSLIKPWNDGGSLTATYEGSGDGSAIFSSDVAEGLDREMIVVFRDGGKTVAVERKVLQVGMREMFVPNDGEFVPSEGGSFNVLKDDKPYTEIEYIESTGTQWIDTGIDRMMFQKTDAMEFGMYPMYRSGAGYIFGVMVGSRGAAIRTRADNWVQVSMWQGGGPTDTNVDTIYRKFDVVISIQNGFYLDGIFQSASGTGYPSLTQIEYFPLCVGAYVSASGQAATEYTISPTKARYYYLKLFRDGELLRDLIPVLDKDNIACMYDKVSGQFFYNQGTGNFIAGNKI